MSNRDAEVFYIWQKRLPMREIKIEDLTDKAIYHICTNGFEQTTIMRDEEDFKTAHNLMAILAYKMCISILVYCLMSNHVHFIIETASAESAKAYINEFLRIYSQYLKRKYGTCKMLKDLNPRPILIDTVSYLKTCIAYVLRNPLSARICTRVEDYAWSSCNCYFRRKSSDRTVFRGAKISEMSIRSTRKVLATRIDLTECPYRIDEEGLIVDESFIKTDLVEKAFMNSGKSFLAHLGKCNDSQMEYQLAIKPECHSSDIDLITSARKLAEKWFGVNNIWELSTQQKCKMIKELYFKNRTTIPQISRVLGTTRDLVHKILST